MAFESIELVRQETIRSIFENNSYLQAVVIHGYGTQGITDFGLHACDAITRVSSFSKILLLLE